MAGVVGGEDHRALEVAHPLAALDLGVRHRLGERQQKAMLDEVADRPHRLLARPAEVTRRSRHDRTAFGPAARAWSVPMPGAADSTQITHGAAHGAGELSQPALTGVPGHFVTRRRRA